MVRLRMLTIQTLLFNLLLRLYYYFLLYKLLLLSASALKLQTKVKWGKRRNLWCFALRLRSTISHFSLAAKQQAFATWPPLPQPSTSIASPEVSSCALATYSLMWSYSSSCSLYSIALIDQVWHLTLALQYSLIHLTFQSRHDRPRWWYPVRLAGGRPCKICARSSDGQVRTGAGVDA